MRNYRLPILFSLVLGSLAFARVSDAIVSIKCDGVTPDDVAINQAIGSGLEVHLPPGVCIINSTINIPDTGGGVSKTLLSGAGFYATTIKASSIFASPQMILVQGSTTITNLGISGSNKNIWGIRNITATSNIPSTFKNLAFTSLGMGGYVNSGAGAVYNISDCFFNSVTLAISNEDWGTSSIISHNNVLGGQGFRFDFTQHSVEGIIIDGNQIISAGGSGTLDFRKCLQCVVSNNVVDDISSGTKPLSLNITGGTLYKVTNNWFGQGLSATSARDLYFSGNTIPNGSPAVINLSVNVQFNDNTIQNPNCAVNCTAGQSLFILNSANVQVHHNNLQDQKGGIYVGGNTHVLVEGNSFSGPCDRSGPMTFIFNTGGTNCGNSLTYPTSW
jgi:hypothetical protein